MHEDDDPVISALPLDELRRRVYAQGADESDERWIRAAAELARRERASRPADPDPGADAADRTAADAGVLAAADPIAPDDSPAVPDDSPEPRPASRRVVVWAVGALAVGLLAGGAIAASLDPGTSATTTAAEGTPRPGADEPPVAGDGSAESPAAASPTPPAPSGPALLGPDSTSDQRSRPVGAIFDTPQQDTDQPPRTVRADVDAASIRAVQTSVGLYAARSAAGDLCLLVFPSGGAGVVTCASPDRIASDGLRVAWTTEFPSRNRDGSTGMITGDVEAVWSGDDLITLTTPDRILAY